jgi:iron complex outermembrane recepter protein
MGKVAAFAANVPEPAANGSPLRSRRVLQFTLWMATAIALDASPALADPPAGPPADPPALAEDEAPKAEAAYLDHIVVTGTRILRRDFDSASPVITVMPEFFESIGAPTVEAAMNRLPQLVPDVSGTSNNPGESGQAFLNLRGLGPTATMVLLNGRRLIPSNGAGVVDVNLIPPTLLESVEIITGGASAVYGSDAVAGVVNFRLRQSFEGVEVGGTWGQTDRGDGEQWDAHLTAGARFADGRGSVYGFVGRSDRELVTQGDRRFSRYALQYVGPGNGLLGPDQAFLAGGNPFIEEGVAVLPIAGPNPVSASTFQELFASYGYPSPPLPLQLQYSFNDDGTLFTRGNGTPNSVANFRGELDPLVSNDRQYAYNFAPPNALQLPLERTSAFGRLSFDVSDSLRLYADGLYADYSVDQQLAATTALNMSMPRSNPYIPPDLGLLLDSRPSPNTNFLWFKRLSELGPRVAQNEYSVYQATLGVDGYLSDAWRIDAYAQFGENSQVRRQTGNALRSRIDELTFAADGGLAACGGFDIFGLGSISSACADYISVNAEDDVDLRQIIAEASIEGPLAELPAGDLRVALGVFHKRDRYTYRADPAASQVLPDGRLDILGFNARDDVRGEERNTDVYVEALVPLLSDRPGVDSLEAGFGYRHAEYRAAGGADAWKAELLYRPVELLRLRGSYQKAVRAPGIIELFEPQLPSTVFLVDIGGDPCEADSAARAGPDAAAVESLCLAQGVPAELLAEFVYPLPFAEGISGGNPDLRPENAETWTLGLAWSPPDHPALGQLQASLDWYQIDVEDAISPVGALEVISLCFDPVVNPAFSPTNPWCTYFSREPETGQIVDAFEINRNVGGLKTAGVDLQLDWSLPLGPGKLAANWLLSWLDRFERNAGPGAQDEDLSGAISQLPGTSLPEWKSLLSAGYTWGGASISARTRYVHSMDTSAAADFKIPSVHYLDLFASYDFGPGLFDGLRIGAGVENLTDRNPPIFPGSAIGSTDPQQYDVLGRRYFVTLNYRL